MSWFLHAVEDRDDHWTCHRGLGRVDKTACVHQGADDAVAHLRRISRTIDGAVRIVLHHADGTRQVLDLDPWEPIPIPVEQDDRLDGIDRVDQAI